MSDWQDRFPARQPKLLWLLADPLPVDIWIPVRSLYSFCYFFSRLPAMLRQRPIKINIRDGRHTQIGNDDAPEQAFQTKEQTCHIGYRYVKNKQPDDTQDQRCHWPGQSGRTQQASSSTVKDFEPDITFLLDAPIEVIRSRKKLNPNDRFESETTDFFEKVRNGYLEIARRYNDRIKVIDASKPLEDVQFEIKKYLKEIINHHD